MSFKKCLQDKVKGKLISQREMDQIVNEYDKLVSRYSKTMGSVDAATKAAEDIATTRTEVLFKKKSNLIKHAQMQPKVIEAIDTTPGSNFGVKTRNFLRRISRRQNTVLRDLTRGLDEFFDQLSSKKLGLEMDFGAMERVVREIYGESTGDAAASSMAKALGKSFDMAHARFKAAGGVIGKLDRYFPQIHDRTKIRNVSFKEWEASVLPHLDREKMVDWETGLPFTEERLAEVMREDYTSIITNGRSDIDKKLAEGKVRLYGAQDIAERRQATRFYRFKDADGFLEYNRKFGAGDDGLFNMTVKYYNSMARDIALMEMMGPRPVAMFDHVMNNMKGVNRAASDMDQKFASGMFEVLTGRVDTSVSDSAWFNALKATQDLLRSAYLGSASVSALGDVTFLKATGDWVNLDGSKIVSNYAKLLNPANKEDRIIAQRMRYIADHVNGTVLGDMRWTGGGTAPEAQAGSLLSAVKGDGISLTQDVVKATSWLANFTNRASGLNAMTNAAKDAISLEFVSALPMQRQTPYAKLGADFVDLLQRNGLTEADWGVIQKAPVYLDDGIEMIRPEDIMKVKGVDTKVKLDVSNKLDDVIFNLREAAVNEGDLLTRAISTGAALGGDARQGTLLRAGASSVSMFKTFPITVLINHVFPAVLKASKGRTSHLMNIAIGTSVIGGLSLQAKEISKGRDPRKVDGRFVMASMLQGGGLGLFGDFLFAEHDRYGRNIQTQLLGPVVALGDDLLKLGPGNIQKQLFEGENNFLPDFVEQVHRLTPAHSLWYARLALERLFFDQLQRMVDPEFFDRRERMEKSRLRDFNQGFWWREGEAAPERAPDFASVVD